MVERERRRERRKELKRRGSAALQNLADRGEYSGWARERRGDAYAEASSTPGAAPPWCFRADRAVATNEPMISEESLLLPRGQCRDAPRCLGRAPLDTLRGGLHGAEFRERGEAMFRRWSEVEAGFPEVYESRV